MTLVVVHSTYLLSRSVTELSKYYLQPVTTDLVGDDFDQKITDYMIAEFKKQEGVDFICR